MHTFSPAMLSWIQTFLCGGLPFQLRFTIVRKLQQRLKVYSLKAQFRWPAILNQESVCFANHVISRNVTKLHFVAVQSSGCPSWERYTKLYQWISCICTWWERYTRVYHGYTTHQTLPLGKASSLLHSQMRDFLYLHLVFVLGFVILCIK